MRVSRDGRTAARVPRWASYLSTQRRRPVSPVDVRCERGHRPQVAVPAVEVEAVADDELVGDVITDVTHDDPVLQGLRLAEHSHDFKAGRTTRLHSRRKVGR